MGRGEGVWFGSVGRKGDLWVTRTRKQGWEAWEAWAIWLVCLCATGEWRLEL